MLHLDTFIKCDFTGAKGMIFIGDKILVYRRDNNTDSSPLLIDLPGGGHEEDDKSPFDTFRRELLEEFGINITPDDILDSFLVQSVVYEGRRSFFFVTKSLAINLDDIHFGNEGSEWFLSTPKEFIERVDGVKGQQDRVQKYLKGELVN